MLNRRQLLTRVSGGILAGAAGVAAVKVSNDRTRWIPQLTKSATLLAEAESGGERYELERTHILPFMDGISLVVFKTKGRGANGRARQIVQRFNKSSIRFARPAISSDGSTLVVFACADAKQVRSAVS